MVFSNVFDVHVHTQFKSTKTAKDALKFLYVMNKRELSLNKVKNKMY